VRSATLWCLKDLRGLRYRSAARRALAIESVLAQDFKDFELILGYDGSTHGSSALARKHADKFPQAISYLEHEDHINRMSASSNLGIRHARGEFITFCDATMRKCPESYPSKWKSFVATQLGMVCGAAIYLVLMDRRRGSNCTIRSCPEYSSVPSWWLINVSPMSMNGSQLKVVARVALWIFSKYSMFVTYTRRSGRKTYRLFRRPLTPEP
jgi:glycosyltransferase involved in cell wall biosynthesis